MASYSPRQDANGKTIHRYVVRRKGAPVRVFTRSTKTEARKAARAYEAEVDRGRVAAGRHTVHDAFDFYEASEEFRRLKSQRSRDNRLKQLGWWRERIGDLPLSDLIKVQRAVQAGVKELLAEGGVGDEPLEEPTANRYLSAAGKAFRVAERDADMGALLLYNPARKVGRFDESDRYRTRIYSDAEFWKLLEACRERSRRLAVMYLVAMSSSARISEIELIKRSSIDERTGEIHLYRTKNGEDRVARVGGIALEELRSYLRAQPHHITGFAFPGGKGAPRAPRKVWSRARRAASVEDTGWHTCRHTSLTWYASLGASEMELKEHGGHKTTESLQGYIHSATRIRSDVATQLLPEPAAVRGARGLAAGGVGG